MAPLPSQPSCPGSSRRRQDKALPLARSITAGTPSPYPPPAKGGGIQRRKPPPLAGGGRGRGRTSVSELILTPMGLVPDIHVVQQASGPTWMAGTSPAMTTKRRQPLESQH